jgi:hypothetical protein
MRCRTWWFRMVSPTLLWWKGELALAEVELRKALEM